MQRVQESIELRPDFAEGLKTWARLLSDEGKWEEAARYYERAVAADSRDAEAAFLLSRAYRKLGETRKADEALARYRTMQR